MSLLIKILITAAFFGGAGLSYYFTADHYQAKIERKLSKQKTDLEASCTADKAITKGVADEFQKKNLALSDRINQLKRVQPARCIVPASRPAVGDNAAAGATVPAGTDGVTTDALYDLAGEAERYRLQLIGCQTFIAETWKAKGQ